MTGTACSVYPNPAHGSFSVTLPPDTGDREVCLLNATGKVVERRTIQSSTSSFTETFTTNSLLPGMYLVKITSKSSIATEKVLIW
jgi:hypothetical protein